MTAPPDLPTFLLARASDRERQAPDIHRIDCDTFGIARRGGDYLRSDCDCGEPARVLADCAATRAVVELHETRFGDDPAAPFQECLVDSESYYCRTLILLVLPYADHSDFDPSWRAGG